MKFEAFLEEISTPKRPESILVVDAGFDALRAVVVEKKDDKLTVKLEASSQRVNFEDALQEVVDDVKRHGWKGQHAILVSPAVCLTVLHLNIPPKNKLKPQQIAESIQWELEPVYNQHKNILTIGQLLQLSGYLNLDQTNDILAKQNELINSKNSSVVFKRFGELAIESQLITKAQLDDCLSRQHWFMNEGDTVKSGWYPLPTSEQADNTDYPWIVAGVNQDLLRIWQAAFSKHQINLEALYPAGGSGYWQQSSNNSGEQGKQDNEVLLELHNGMIAASTLLDGVPQQMQVMPATKESLLSNVSELISGLDQSETPIRLIDCLSSNPQQTDQIMADLQTILGRSVEAEQIKAGKINLPLRNATRHYLREKQTGYIEGVSVRDPLPPLMQRFESRAVLAGLLAVGLMVLTELGLLATSFWHESQIDSISEDVGRIRDEIKRINEKTDAVNKLKAEIDKKKIEKKQASTMVTLLTKELPERNDRLIQLMNELQTVITDDLVVDSITEDTLLGFNFSAWALSEEAAQSFIKNFQLAIHPMGYRVKNVTVNQNTGRLGLIGYSLRFFITDLSDQTYSERSKLRRKRR